MANGTVKWFNLEKGFGFILPDEGGSDIFVHIRALEKAGLHQLHQGQRVNYEIGSGNGKSFAINVKLLDFVS